MKRNNRTTALQMQRRPMVSGGRRGEISPQAHRVEMRHIATFYPAMARRLMPAEVIAAVKRSQSQQARSRPQSSPVPSLQQVLDRFRRAPSVALSG